MGMREKLIDIVEAYADFLDWDTKEEMVDSIMGAIATDTNVGHKTNADHIRSMTDEGLAYLLHDYYCEGHADGLHHIYAAMPISDVREWLKQPYGGDT